MPDEASSNPSPLGKGTRAGIEADKKKPSLSEMATALERAQRALVAANGKETEARAAVSEARELVDRLQAEMDVEIESIRRSAPLGSRWNKDNARA